MKEDVGLFVALVALIALTVGYVIYMNHYWTVVHPCIKVDHSGTICQERW